MRGSSGTFCAITRYCGDGRARTCFGGRLCRLRVCHAGAIWLRPPSRSCFTATSSARNAVQVVVHYLRAHGPWLTLHGLQLHSPCHGGLPTAKLAAIHRIVPDEMMLMTFGWLNPFALGVASCVCRRWIILYEHPLLWRRPSANAFLGGCDLGENLRLLRSYCNGSWKRMFLWSTGSGVVMS